MTIHVGEGINAQSFPYLEENDVREVIGNLSVGGKSIFRKLWKEYRIAVRRYMYTAVSCIMCRTMEVRFVCTCYVCVNVMLMLIITMACNLHRVRMKAH